MSSVGQRVEKLYEEIHGFFPEGCVYRWKQGQNPPIDSLVLVVTRPRMAEVCEGCSVACRVRKAAYKGNDED